MTTTKPAIQLSEDGYCESVKRLSYVLSHVIKSHKYKCILENRAPKWKFGTKNYGEIIGLRNKSDGDRWDVFAPGYSQPLRTNIPYVIQDILGVFLLKNGNHKIAIRLFVTGYDEKLTNDEIELYCSTYSSKLNKKGIWLQNWRSLKKLAYILSNVIKSKKHKCVIEDRQSLWMSETENYGEITQLRNKPDDENRLNIFVPGYSQSLRTNVPYVIQDILGVFLMKNGNHKIGIRLFVPGYDEKLADQEIELYCSTYSSKLKSKGIWMKDWRSLKF